MARFVTVNDFPGSKAAGGPFDPDLEANPGGEFDAARPDAAWQAAGSTLADGTRQNQGPCLYLGPSGQRCSNAATVGGFCTRHQPGEASTVSRGVSRLAAAGIGILAVMWPVLADLLREVLRWIHSH
ncbi:MAG: hypothetical protein WA211_08980 [Candidatus Acidiferrales bacterium]|jgi:hypothetical protein